MENSKRIRDDHERQARARRVQPNYSRRTYREMARITQAIFNYLQLTMEVQHGHSRY